MWELDCEVGWALKNWCFWTVVLEKTLENPLDCKEIQPVHPKGNQSCVFFGKVKVKVKSLSRVWLLATPWTVAHQAPLSMGFSRQEYWSSLPCPPPGDPPDPGIEPVSLLSPALADEFCTTSTLNKQRPLILPCPSLHYTFLAKALSL